MMQLAKQEQIAKFQPFLKTSIFWTLETTLTIELQKESEKAIDWFRSKMASRC